MSDVSDGRMESNAAGSDPVAGGPEDRRDRPGDPGAEGMAPTEDGGGTLAGAPGPDPDADELPTPPPVESPAAG